MLLASAIQLIAMLPTTKVSKFDLLSNASFQFIFILKYIEHILPIASFLRLIHHIDDASYKKYGNVAPKPFLKLKDR